MLFRAALLAGDAKRHFPAPESTFSMVFRAMMHNLALLEIILGAERRDFRECTCIPSVWSQDLTPSTEVSRIFLTPNLDEV